MKLGNPKRRAGSLIEPLEARQHLSAQQIQGAVTQGLGSLGEIHIPGVTVFADANANGSLDDGEASTTSDQFGDFSIVTDTVLGLLRAVPPEGFVFNRTSVVELTGSPPFVYVSLLAKRPVTGTVYQDLNNDQQPDEGDTFFAGVTIYADQNENRRLDDGDITTTTDASGHYSITTEKSPSYVGIVMPSGWVANDVTLSLVGDLRNFRISPAPSISGTIYNDLNLNGARDNGEAGVPALQVFLDDNGDGVPSDGEPTTATDAEGNYTFQVATSGLVKINAPGWTVLRPTAHVSTAPDHVYQFSIPIYQSTTVGGVVYQDLNRNGLRDNDEQPVANALVYAPFSYAPPAENSSNNIGSISYFGLCGPGVLPPCVIPPGGAVIEGPTRQIFAQTAADGSFTLHDMPITNLTVALDSKKFVRTSDGTNNEEIGVLPIRPNGYGVAEVHGRVFDDVNNNGVFDPGEKLLSGVVVSAGERRNDVLGVYGQYAQSGDTTDANGNFILTGLRQGNYAIKIMGGPLPMDSELIDFSLDRLDVKTIDLPAHLYCNMTGQVLKDGGPQVQASLVDNGMMVYLDRNNNQKLDPGELSTTTIQGSYYFDHVPDGPYTVRVIAKHARIVGQLPYGVASHDQVINNSAINIDHPFSIVPIRVYLDLNSNGRKDAAEPFLQKGVLSFETDDGEIDPRATYSFKSDKGRLPNFEFAFGTTRIRLQTRPASKLGQYSKSVRINITNPTNPPSLLSGLRRHK
jgi:hypothetical protein